jgi:thioredoxin reductase (NADPH)
VSSYDVIVVGSGPSGLATAIESTRAGLSTVILEKGSVLDYLRRFPVNLIWFSTPEMLEIGGVPFVTSTVRPTRVDTLNYYQKVIAVCGLDVRPYDAVTAIRRVNDVFEVRTAKGVLYLARYVVVATGYFDHPNRLGVPGEDLPKVSHYYSEPYEFFQRDVLVVGGRNSAAEAALDLYRHGARVTLVHRGVGLSDGIKYWVLPDIENRLKGGQIAGHLNSTVKEITHDRVILSTPEGVREIPNHHVFVLVGFRPDGDLLKQFGIELDAETLVPHLEPDLLETTVPGLFVAGSIVAGRDTNKIFVENGRAHGGLIVRAIRGREGQKS